MIEAEIAKLVDRQDLSLAEMEQATEAVMRGQCSDAEVAAFLTALRIKGETVQEIVAAALVLRKHVTPIDAGSDRVLDTCGTGGDNLKTFNISTATALVVAACGVPVAKHGNRAVSSPSGSAEVLEQLGVNIQATVPVVERCIRQVGVGFCYAPLLHPSMRHALPVRRQIRIRTIFNLLGPLTNPAGAQHQLLGVSRQDLVDRLAEALLQLGTRRAFVVCGHDGLDEVTLTGPTFAAEVRRAAVREIEWSPDDFGLAGCGIDQLRVASAAESAERIREVLHDKHGPARDIVLANAAVALLAAEKVSELPSGVELAAHALKTGQARRVLDSLVRLTHSAQQ